MTLSFFPGFLQEVVEPYQNYDAFFRSENLARLSSSTKRFPSGLSMTILEPPCSISVNHFYDLHRTGSGAGYNTTLKYFS